MRKTATPLRHAAQTGEIFNLSAAHPAKQMLHLRHDFNGRNPEVYSGQDLADELGMHAGHHFQPVREALYYNGFDIVPALIMLAKIALHHDSADHVFKTGTVLLERFLAEETGTDKGPVKLENRFWDDVRQRIKDRETRQMPQKGHAVKASAKAFSYPDDRAIAVAKPAFGFGAVFGR